MFRLQSVKCGQRYNCAVRDRLLRALRRVAERRMVYAWDRAGLLAIIESLLAPELLQEAEQVLGDEATFSVYDELRGDLERYCTERARAFGQSLWRQIVQTIYDANLQGWTTAQLMDALEQLVQGYATYRLETLLRTESLRFENWASVYAMARMPEVVAYRYDVTLDDRTSDICKGFANKVVRKSELIYIPPLHYNCRTVLLPVLDDETLPLAEPTDLPRPPEYFMPPASILRKLKGEA